MFKGEITAFLSLIFVFLISFVMGTMEAAVIQQQKSQSRLDTDAALYSVFGEYQKELFEEYQIFGLEGSYETGDFSEQAMINRLHYYGTENIHHEVEGIQFLTDNKGQALAEKGNGNHGGKGPAVQQSQRSYRISEKQLKIM